MAHWEDKDELGDAPNYAQDAHVARQWARDLLTKGNFVLLDCETTERNPTRGEPVQIAVLSPAGNILLDTLVLPHDGLVPDAVTHIHGITTQTLMEQKAPTFRQVYPRLLDAVGDRLIMAYNAPYDRAILANACRIAGVDYLTNEWEDVMLPWSAICGEWWAWKGEYKWAKMPNLDEQTAHGARQDCLSLLALLEKMAADGE